MSIITEQIVDIPYKRVNYKVVIERYSSAMEVVENCRERKITDSDFKNMSSEHVSKSWEGVSSYEEALQYMRNGYQPTVEKLKERVKFTAMGDGKRFSIKNNIVGFNPVVPLAIIGVPNCMVDMQMKPIKCKVIDVYYDMTQSCGTSPETIIKAGQKLLGVIMELERQGYRFNIYAMQSYSDNDGADLLVVKVKSSTQPIDLKRISFPLTHVGFFRVIGFDWYSKCPKATYRGGYGRALSYELNKKQQDSFAKKVFGDNAIYITGTLLGNNSEEYIAEVLRDAGNKKA